VLNVERQVGLTIDKAGITHAIRYLFASSFIEKEDEVLDVFCGTGYGSRYMAQFAKVTAFDKYEPLWPHPNVTFITAHYPDITLDKTFDLITCFEAIEHVDPLTARTLLSSIWGWTKEDGTLLISSPNQEYYPYDDAIEHHFFHYTPQGLERDLNAAGFSIVEWKNQPAKGSTRLNSGPGGKYMIAVCERV